MRKRLCRPTILFFGKTVNCGKLGEGDGIKIARMMERPMPAPIAIIAALPREVAALVRGVAPDATLVREGIWLYRVDGGVVVAAGMGEERAAIAVEAALAAGDVGMLVSAGLAGSCAAEARVGSVMEAGVVVDARTGERFGSEGVVLATTETIASVGEKARLREVYGASIVDMEAASVARLAEANGLRFRAIKGVSDAHDFELSSLARFAGERGSFRTGAFALHTAARPWTWGKTLTLGRGSARALDRLGALLRRMIVAG
jgi:adenosylhomocysteine nucleosidase